ncbi:ankyrin repeat domain-containing protein [Wolbachia endosymbiont (group A) of Clivina fossor]|uniref:ankyrin repeat domain-containing protein n=1 Tax=Wolbachia endosymbiont (group A) of Clivina fossor TaxID=3066133 RepID=UPI0031330ED5
MIVAESIGGQEWSEANTGTGQSVSDQQIPESIQDTSVSSSSQSPILSSSGYFSPGNTSTPYSHISENEVLEMNQSMNDQQIQDTSISSSNEDEVFESNAFGDEEKHKQQGGELGDRIRELEQENTYFKGQNLALKSNNKKITEEGEEGDECRLKLEKSEKKVKELECRLKNKLAEGCEENKRLEQVVSALKENLQSKDDEAKSLHNLLKDRMSEIQSTNRANEELQKRLDQHETEISRLRAKTTELRNDMKEIVEDLKDDHEKQLVGLLEREKKLTDTISQLDKKNQELVGELNELERGALEAKNLYPSSGMSLTDEMSDTNKKLEQKESHQQVEKVDISTQTGIEYDSGDCNQETTPKNKVVDSDDFSLFAQGTSNRPECYELGQRNETDRVIDICVEHTLSDQSKIDDSDSDSKNEQKLEEKLSTEQEWSETNEPYDGEYELIKEEHLSQISCNDRLEILRKQGHSESDIDEICSHGDSWYTQTTIPTLDNKAPPSLMDSRDSLRKRVCVWLAQEYGLTENQKQLNIELLDILKHLDWYDESALFDYDNGGVVMLKEFLENNKNNPDLKVILDLERGESGATVLHAVSGARIYEIGRDHEHRAVGLLLAAGADPNAQDNEGETPLYYAAAIGNGEGVSSLLWKNANLNICNKQGKTPQQIAIDSGHHNVAGLLLTDKQKKLRDKLYYNIRANVSDLIHFTKILKEFLDEHKNNPDLKVVLNIRSERGESEVLEFAERISYFNGAVGAEVRNLFLEVGASCDVLYRVVKEERPFVLWRSLTLNQQKRLDDFLYRISKAEDMDKLEKVVDEVIRSGVQLNFNKDFSPKDPIACNWYSSTDYVIKRIGELNKLKRNPKVASDIICKLVSRGAILYNRNSMDVIDELELESKDHRANMKKAYADYINNAHKFIKVVKRATNGRLNDVRMDNSVFYLEYSEDSTKTASKKCQSGIEKAGSFIEKTASTTGKAVSAAGKYIDPAKRTRQTLISITTVIFISAVAYGVSQGYIGALAALFLAAIAIATCLALTLGFSGVKKCFEKLTNKTKNSTDNDRQTKRARNPKSEMKDTSTKSPADGLTI